MVVSLIIFAVIAVGVETDIDRSLIDPSGLTKASLIGWQLVYILPVALLTNAFFLSVSNPTTSNPRLRLLLKLYQSYWLRVFSARSDNHLKIGVSIAAFVILCVLVFVGVTGLLAAWSGVWPGDPPQEGYLAFFLLLAQFPAWIVAFIVVMVVSLSTAAFDSLQTATVSTVSNDLFRNKLNIWVIRAGVVLLIIPVVVVALKSPDILQIFLISDLVSAATIPVLLIGLNDHCHWWSGFEFVVGGLGGILTVFIFGTIYFGNAEQGARLILLQNGLYSGDWSVFGKDSLPHFKIRPFSVFDLSCPFLSSFGLGKIEIN